jgi:hypothetical protein
MNQKLGSFAYFHPTRRNMNNKIGPSGVRALPLAAGINECGHYSKYFSFFFFFFVLPPLFKTTEGVVEGFLVFFENFKSCPMVPKLWI